MYSGSEFDAVNGAVGILFVHDLDEKIFDAMDVVANNWKKHWQKIFALLLWVLTAVIIALSSACKYGVDNDFKSFLSGAEKYCKLKEFKCGMFLLTSFVFLK